MSENELKTAVADIIRRTEGALILYHHGLITADEYNEKVLVIINKARGALGYDQLGEVPEQMRKP